MFRMSITNLNNFNDHQLIKNLDMSEIKNLLDEYFIYDSAKEARIEASIDETTPYVIKITTFDKNHYYNHVAKYFATK